MGASRSRCLLSTVGFILDKMAAFRQTFLVLKSPNPASIREKPAQNLPPNIDLLTRTSRKYIRVVLVSIQGRTIGERIRCHLWTKGNRKSSQCWPSLMLKNKYRTPWCQRSHGSESHLCRLSRLMSKPSWPSYYCG